MKVKELIESAIHTSPNATKIGNSLKKDHGYTRSKGVSGTGSYDSTEIHHGKVHPKQVSAVHERLRKEGWKEEDSMSHSKGESKKVGSKFTHSSGAVIHVHHDGHVMIVGKKTPKKKTVSHYD